MFQKILITRFPYESTFGGLEVHTLNVAEAFKKRGKIVRFCGSCSVLLKEFSARGFAVTPFWGGRGLVTKKAFGLFVFTFPLVILNFLRLALLAKYRWRTELVYMLSLNEKLFLTPWLRLLGIQSVWVEHENIGKWLQKNPLRFWFRYLSQKMSIITVSAQIQTDLKLLRIKPQNLHFILNGIDFAEIQKTKFLSKAKLRAQFGLTEKQIVIALITRLSPEKGLDYFLTALRRLSLKNVNLVAVIAGEGKERENFEKMASGLPVKLLGELDHTAALQLLQTTDYFVLPSSQPDSFGLAAAEALALAKPVIVTQVCGISHFLENGKHGVIIPPKDAVALEQALEKFFNDATWAQKLGAAGAQLAFEKFSLARMVEEYLAVLEG